MTDPNVIADRPINLDDASPASAPATDLSSLRPDHPRLFLDRSRIEALKAQDDEVGLRLKALVQNRAEAVLEEPDLDYPPANSNSAVPGPGGMLTAVRQVQGRVLATALTYRLTDDHRYLDKAVRDLRQLAALADWNPSHFLTVGEAAFAVGVGYDWLHDDLDEADRALLADAIRTKALLPSLDARPGSWLDAAYNWNPVVNGGLAVAALAIAEREPDLAAFIVNRSITYIPCAAEVYEPDGGWPESPSYWAYGTVFYAVAVEAIRSALGSDLGLMEHPGLLRTGDYVLQMAAPSGQLYNYSDYHFEGTNEPAMLWLAREARRPEWLTGEIRALAQLTSADVADRFHAHRLMPLELLWWEPELLAHGHSVTAPLHWTAQGHVPLATMRTSWDADATYVALKGGSPDYSHAHMDSGSFVLEAGGVRWAVDLGTESYDLMRAAGIDLWNYAQDGTRWSTFRVGPEGHNILRFDDARQRVSGCGTVTALSSTDGVVGDVLDLTSLYADAAQDVERTIRLHSDGTVDFHDRWTLKEQPSVVDFQWLTYADASRTDDGLQLTQAGRILDLILADAGLVEIAIEDASPPRAAQDTPNPGLTRVVLRTRTPAHGSGELHLTARLLWNAPL